MPRARARENVAAAPHRSPLDGHEPANVDAADHHQEDTNDHPHAGQGPPSVTAVGTGLEGCDRRPEPDRHPDRNGKPRRREETGKECCKEHVADQLFAQDGVDHQHETRWNENAESAAGSQRRGAKDPA